MSEENRGKGGEYIPHNSIKGKKTGSRTRSINSPQSGKSHVQDSRERGAKTRKNRNYGLYYFLVVAIVVSLLVIAVLNLGLKVKQIDVSGTDVYTAQEVITASSLVIDSGLFSFDKEETGEKIENSLPYVDQAKVSRKWFNIVKIEITQAQPRSIYIKDNTFFLVSDKNKVLSAAKEQQLPKYTLVRGIEIESANIGSEVVFADEFLMVRIEELFAVLEKYDLKVLEIDFSNINNVKLNYQQRIILELGYPDNLDEKINMAKNTIKKEISNANKGILNLSIANQAYFRPDSSDKTIYYSQNPPVEDSTEDDTQDDQYQSSEPREDETDIEPTEN